MKKYMILSLMAVLAFAGCEKSEEIPVIRPDAKGTFTDERDGQEYTWVKYRGLEWMTLNLRYVPTTGTYLPLLVPGDAYDDPENHAYHAEYGFLYSYEAAVAAVPAGWRIPTDEDWQSLEEAFGMSASDLGSKGDRGEHTGLLMRQDDSGTGFNLQLGGFITPRTSTIRLSDLLFNEKSSGLYWSSTLDPEKADGRSRFYRQIRYNSNQVTRQSMNSEQKLLSVRCVRDAR